MSEKYETPFGVLFQNVHRSGERRWYLEVPGCPRGGIELLDDEQLHGRLSVYHGAICSACGYHETHNFAEHLPSGEGDG